MRLSRHMLRRTPHVRLIEIKFLTPYHVLNFNQVIGVLGSSPHLGKWNPVNAVFLNKLDTCDWWEGTILLPLNEYFEWKLIVFDKRWKRTVRWEERGNRWNWINRGPVDISVQWNGPELTSCTLVECSILPCHCITAFSCLGISYKDQVSVMFVTHFQYTDDDQVLAVTGSGKYLGNWNPAFSRQFDKTLSLKYHRLSMAINMPVNEKAEWKFVLINRRHRYVIRWEDHFNRHLETRFPEGEMTRRKVTIGANWNCDTGRIAKSFKCLDWSCTCRRYWPTNNDHPWTLESEMESAGKQKPVKHVVVDSDIWDKPPEFYTLLPPPLSSLGVD